MMILLVDEQVGRVWLFMVLRLLCCHELLKIVAELTAEIDGEAFHFTPQVQRRFQSDR